MPNHIIPGSFPVNAHNLIYDKTLPDLNTPDTVKQYFIDWTNSVFVIDDASATYGRTKVPGVDLTPYHGVVFEFASFSSNGGFTPSCTGRFGTGINDPIMFIYDGQTTTDGGLNIKRSAMLRLVDGYQPLLLTTYTGARSVVNGSFSPHMSFGIYFFNANSHSQIQARLWGIR